MITIPATVIITQAPIPARATESAVSIPARAAAEYITTDAPPYTGPVTFTPTEEAQTIQIAGKAAEQDITINPIPSNYGKVSWDGTNIYIE